MHAVLNATGHIVHCGPTLKKLRDYDLVGRRFLEVFSVKKPRDISDLQTLSQHVGKKLKLQMTDAPQTGLVGVLCHGLAEGQLLVDLSFGISVVKAVGDYAVSAADFAPTDLTVEMLYLAEAQTAAMASSRNLNQRLQGAKIAAEEQAYTDTLTGLKNRRAIDHILARNVDWETPFAYMGVDLDWFKAVNDTLGHAAGDHVLQTVARILVEETRDNDTVARVGGDEFVIMLPYSHDRSVLEAIGQRIIAALSKPIPFQGEICRISASIGTAFYDPGQEATLEQVIDNADVALYASKHAGRGRQTFYEPALRDTPDHLEPPKGRAAG